jgi:hypothetical protein
MVVVEGKRGMISEEKLDKKLAREAKIKGWAPDKIKYAARILVAVRDDCIDKTMSMKINEVINYLLKLKVDKDVD